MLLRYTEIMSLLARFQTVDDSDKTRAVRTLIEDSTPDFDFFFLITLSVLMATFGLLAGSETVIIGSMLIAPILNPVLSLALGISMSDHQLIRRSLTTIAKAALVAVFAGLLATMFFTIGSDEVLLNSSVAARTSPSLLFLAVGVISGLAVTYALVRPGLSETLPGVAISVALIPPLAVIGIGAASFNFALSLGALMMFSINVIGIVAAAMIAFSLMDVHGKRHIAGKIIKKEDERVEHENEAVAKVDSELRMPSA